MKTSTREWSWAGANQSRSSEWWEAHFRRDLARDWRIAWARGGALTTAEKDRVGASIAEFQRGESSEARNYLAKSARFAEEAGDPAFAASAALFVRAENAHAGRLLEFMERQGIPAQGSSPRDGVFRRLRALSDLGWTSRVILVAELVAQEYYPCLRAATTHPALVRICDRIETEEAAHIRFQVERIARIERARSWWRVGLRDAAQTVLMAGTACVVHAGHGRVLGARLTFGEFFARVVKRNRRAIAAMRGVRSAAETVSVAMDGSGVGRMTEVEPVPVRNA